MLFKSRPILNKEFLLSHNTQETYLQFYLQLPVKKGLFHSPFRTDATPSCGYFKNRSGDILFKDFNGSFCGDFIEVVKTKYNVNYRDALMIIATDFGLIDGKIRKPNIQVASTFEYNSDESTLIQVTIQPYTDKDLEWWGNYGVTQDILNLFRVYSCKNVFLRGDLWKCSSKDCPIYGYYFGHSKNGNERWKCYFPTQRTSRFICNCNVLQGSMQLPRSADYLVITKSMKDVMCLYSLGITAIAPNSESTFITQNQLLKLKDRFKYIVVLYDNDIAGIKNMNKIKKEFKLPCFYIPRSYEAKDISDFYKKYGKTKTKELINYAKSTYWSICKE